MRVLRLRRITAIFFLLALGSPQPAQASLLGEVLELIVKSIPAPPPRAGRAAPPVQKPQLPGLRSAVKVLDTQPKNTRPEAQEIMAAYAALLDRAGVTQELKLVCPACVSTNPTLPDEAVRAAKLMLGNDEFLAGRAAGNAIGGALTSYSARTGRRINIPKGRDANERDKVVAALAETLGGLRAGALDEAAFIKALETNLKKLAEEPNPKARFGLDEIGYDAEKRMLTFNIRAANTKVKIANLDIGRYVDRMTGLVFGAGGIYLLQPPDGDTARSPRINAETLEIAKIRQAEALAKNDADCGEFNRGMVCIERGIDWETGKRLKEAVWSEALLEELQFRKKFRD